ALEPFDPNTVVAFGPAEGVPLLEGKDYVDGKPAVYVCERCACRQPVTEVGELTALWSRAVALLSLEHLTRRFGGIVAVDGVTFDVAEGEIAGLIGPNGAGKTTVFNLVTRLYSPDDGEIAFDGSSLLRTPPHDVVRRGIARTFQNVELFGSMTVLEHVLMGRHVRRGRGARELIEYTGLSGLAHREARELPYGVQKRVELARALASGPRLLLLDEPAGGLNHEEVQELGA